MHHPALGTPPSQQSGANARRSVTPSSSSRIWREVDNLQRSRLLDRPLRRFQPHPSSNRSSVVLPRAIRPHQADTHPRSSPENSALQRSSSPIGGSPTGQRETSSSSTRPLRLPVRRRKIDPRASTSARAEFTSFNCPIKSCALSIPRLRLRTSVAFGPRRSHSTSIFTRFFSASCSLRLRLHIRLLALDKLRVRPLHPQKTLGIHAVQLHYLCRNILKKITIMADKHTSKTTPHSATPPAHAMPG